MCSLAFGGGKTCGMLGLAVAYQALGACDSMLGANTEIQNAKHTFVGIFLHSETSVWILSSCFLLRPSYMCKTTDCGGNELTSQLNNLSLSSFL